MNTAWIDANIGFQKTSFAVEKQSWTNCSHCRDTGAASRKVSQSVGLDGNRGVTRRAAVGCCGHPVDPWT